MKVYFFKRKPFDTQYSIELLFKTVINSLPGDINTKVIECSRHNSGILNKMYNIIEVLFKKQGDVNHITGDVHYLAYFLNHKKTVLTIHDLNLLYSGNKLKKLIHQRFWLKWPINCAKIVTAISSTTKKDIVKFTNCDPAKIHVVYNCVPSHFNPKPKAFNKQKPTILHIGTKPNKNLTGLIRAIEGINCRLEIVGQPSDEAQVLLNKFEIDHQIQSGLSDEAIFQKYVSCDIVSFVSFFEGFGLPIVEANSVERVVVTSNISCMPEIAGNAACLVNPYDVASIRAGLLKIIRDDSYREQLIINGRMNKQRFSPREISRQYAELYRMIHFKN